VVPFLWSKASCHPSHWATLKRRPLEAALFTDETLAGPRT
jgi:hypothetical protein